MKKDNRKKGKISLRNFLQEFTTGDKVAISVEPAVQSGIMNKRFFGKIGTIARSQGNCYVVNLKDGNKHKEVIAHPVHLKKVE